MILIPDRNFYMVYVILIFALYLIAPLFDYLYDYAKRLLKMVTRLIPISYSTLSLESISSETKKSVLINWLSRIITIVVGLSLLAYGLWISMFAVGVNLVVGLAVLLVAGIAFTLGPQLIAISLSLSNTSDLNDTLQSLSYMTAAALLIFGIGTYIVSWNVVLVSERQSLALAGIFVTIWACSLVIDSKLYVRLVSDILLLGGTILGLNLWFSLGNQLLQMIGILCLCVVIVHLIVVLTALVHTRSGKIDTRLLQSNEIDAQTP
jgi:hypothetical protein